MRMLAMVVSLVALAIPGRGAAPEGIRASDWEGQLPALRAVIGAPLQLTPVALAVPATASQMPIRSVYTLIKADLAVYNQHVVGQVKDIKDIGAKVSTGYDTLTKSIDEAEAATEPAVQQAKLQQAKDTIDRLMKLDGELYGHAGANGYEFGYINIWGNESLPTILPEAKGLIDQALAQIKKSVYSLIKADLAVYNQYVVGQIKDIKDIGAKVTAGYNAVMQAVSEAEAATEPAVQQAKLQQAKGMVEQLMKIDDELYGHAGANGYEYGYINIRNYEFLPTILPETKDLLDQALTK